MKKYAVIGCPVEHSLSPMIYTSLFEKYGIDAVFLKHEIRRGGLSREQLLEYAGFACTMPHKADIIPLLDAVDEDARRMNSVNIVKNDGGRFVGCSTDGEGLKNAIEEAGHDLCGNIVILGAGGAARSAAYTAKKTAKCVTIAARNEKSRKNIADEMRVVECDESCLFDRLHECDVIINATPRGMKDNDEFSRLDFLDCMKHGSLAVDMVYFPHETRFLSYAKAAGMDIVFGENMLIHQALIAFYVWTDIYAKREDVPPLF